MESCWWASPVVTSRLFVLVLLARICLSPFAESLPLRSVPDLENAMYQSLQGYPCVRLLNLTGEVGCGNPGRRAVVAPVRRFETAKSVQLHVPTTVVLPSSELASFLERVERESSVAAQVAGLLVEFDSEKTEGSGVQKLGFSADTTFPQAEFAPYENRSFEWNPTGRGILEQRFNFPVFLLSQESTAGVREMAAKNKKADFKPPLTVAEFSSIMQTTKSGTPTSVTCLKELSCLPLGGYSVWSALPAINISSPAPPKPIVLAMASMDSASFFRDVTPGADSPISGMLALLAAVDALSQIKGIENLKKQLVFLVLTGEAMGYIGSRQFLAELTAGGPSVTELNASLIYQVLEVGSVGKAINLDGSVTFYAHKEATATAAPTQQILDALQASASTLREGNDASSNIEVQMASKSNPGIPPSSLMSFVHRDDTVAGVVLEEFDSAFHNLLYHSHYDDAANVNTSAVVAAASLVARSLYLLANDSVSAVDVPLLQTIQVNTSLVEDMVGCLLSTQPGMTCDLVKSLITPTQVYANHYVGVFLNNPSSTPLIETVDDTSRFVWNFLADRTDLRMTYRDSAQREECTLTCRNLGEVCVNSTSDHKGWCVVSTTRYVPAFSPRLHYGAAGWELLPLEAGDKMGAADPVWTESFWSTIGLRIYLQESPLFEELVLLSGASVTMASFFAIVSTKAVFRKRLKIA